MFTDVVICICINSVMWCLEGVSDHRVSVLFFTMLLLTD